ncbi:acetyl-CoA carboxylase biotin carboxyl carrier protein subunit [Maribacter sp. TH_r10]|uniref:acetyl-CoA carboxylase biotin carboxyl carrier protein subunit n=1 Tax=Maribacter sp. TH_r10 TaxID=3082086 RepID=UPI0029555FA6|nr:acetyl-CoA carboxylase biotin carboxyl carrier protein subunit [Maribacter sp. TH_r10]MDV7140051.1 acetyl-CoA carboxylase biotin carboxyl carrier protein subunit [Maribacter sp. TH_r10]|tara:strand:- start:364 stop:849 length:486 start_codon:yes stop_codon:yes gene_type:complete
MNKKFKVNVNHDMSLNIMDQDISSLDALPTSETTYHILKDNKPFLAEILSSDFNKKKYTIKVNTSTYETVISDDLDLLINEMGFSTGSTKNVDAIHAPMPGLILEINVSIGQTVKEEDPLLILEAMKMENVIASPRTGTIKSISINKGEAVEKKQLLIEFE